MRKCSKCQVEKPNSEFRVRRGKPISICKQCEREKQREYYWSNPKKYREVAAKSMRKQRQNPKRAEEIRSKAREYYHAKGKYREAEYYREMKDKTPWRWRARNLARNISKEITEDWLREKWSEQNGLCALSGREMEVLTFHVDHIVPRNLGGGDDLGNLRLVTPEANAAKGGMTDDDLIALCRDILKTQIPEMIGYAILEAESTP